MKQTCSKLATITYEKYGIENIFANSIEVKILLFKLRLFFIIFFSFLKECLILSIRSFGRFM